MRTPARPRLPDGDCVFISDARIVARADAPFIAVDMTWLGLTPPPRPCAYCLLGFETSIKSSLETERERVMAWVDRNAYAERLWAFEDTRDIKVITGMRRSVKSELMKVLSASVARKGPSSNNVYIDLLDLDNEPLLEHHALHLLPLRRLRLL